MITKNDPTKNTNLFKAAENLLKSDAAQEILKAQGKDFLYPADFAIHNINDYFACLKDLAYLEEALPKREEEPVYVDPIFTILPTTEDTLQINANTRDIKIPDNFVKYGVGVQGDEIAEIIYFSIDRFFDAVDLAEREILIQWKHDKDPTEEEYLSAVYKKSLTLQPGKIVFGWPISGEMTTKAGNILFSVRFYERGVDSQGNDILNYSFGTLTKAIKIQPALDFQIDAESLSNVINKNNKIFNNLSNSLKVDLNYEVAIPVFTGYFTVVESIVDGEKAFVLSPVQVKKCNLPVTLAVKAEIPRTVDADAQMVSSSPLTYEWKHMDKDGKTELCNSSIQYFKVDLTKEEVSNPNEKYYIKDDSLEGYSVYSGTYDTNLFDDGVELYTRYSTCTPNGPGSYTAKVTNLYSSGAYKETDSDTWEIPYPQAPEFELINPAPNQTFTIRDNNFIQAKVISPDDGVVEAQWYYSENSDEKGNPEQEDPITSKTPLTTTWTPDKEGYYYLKYSNNKNNARETRESDMIAAFYQASEIGTIIHKVEGEEILNPPVNGNSAIITNPGDTLSVEIPQLDYQGDISYVWYEYMPDGQNNEVATGNTYIPNESGWYYCTITNEYRGTYSPPKNSAYFSVSIPGR